MIPGRTLHRLAARLCSAHTLERVVEPAIADLQKEFGMPTSVFARAWVLGVGYLAIMKVIAICAISVSAATDDERRAIVRTWVWSVCIVLAMTALLIVPPYYNLAPEIRGASSATALVTTLVPQAVPLAIPFGIAFGLALGLAVQPTLNLVKRLLLGAIAASALSFCVLVWGMPAGNQAFKEMVNNALYKVHRGPVTEWEKGHNEMTLSELRHEIARVSASGERGDARLAEFRLHLRIALAGASLALVSVLLAMPIERHWLRGLYAFAACIAYWALMFAGELGARSGNIAPPLAAWLPNLALVLSAMAIVIVSSRSSRLRGSMRPAP